MFFAYNGKINFQHFNPQIFKLYEASLGTLAYEIY